jgi:integrase
MGVKVKERQKGSGIWWLFIDHKGKRKAKKVGTDRRTAIEAAKKIEAKLTLEEFKIGTAEEKKVPTFGEYATLWLETYVKSLRRKSTYERYQVALIKHIFPAIGNISLDQVTRGDIRALLLKHHTQGRSKSAVCTLRDICSGPFVAAIDEELISVNPVAGVLKRLNIKREKKLPIEPLTHKEVNLFLKTCILEKAFREHYPFFLTAFRTGMRLGELLALKWGDVDFHGKFIRVSKSYRKGELGPTKTSGERRVDMSDHLIETLGKLLIKRKREALETEKGEVVEILFHRKGKSMEQNHIRRVFKRILQKAGLREIRLHDTRHSFASLLLSEGVTPVYVKEQLGHSSIQMTVDIYGHLIPNSNREAVNRLDFPQPSATQAQPAENENGQDVEILPAFMSMVPKAGLEPARA